MRNRTVKPCALVLVCWCGRRQGSRTCALRYKQQRVCISWVHLLGVHLNFLGALSGSARGYACRHNNHG
eukprot:1147666-Pelagomonas_calceolata.AAC.5